jgi:hypothetical protein
VLDRCSFALPLRWFLKGPGDRLPLRRNRPMTVQSLLAPRHNRCSTSPYSRRSHCNNHHNRSRSAHSRSLGTEIRTRRENAGEQKVRSIGPEGIIIVIRPEGEGEHVANKERPEHRAGPAAPAIAPTIPPGSVELPAPTVPAVRITERVAIETSGAEIGRVGRRDCTFGLSQNGA